MKTLRFQSFVLVSLSFILGFSEFIIVGIINDVAQQFSVSVAAVGLLVTLFAAVYAIATPLISLLIGKHRLYWSLVLLVTIFIAGNLLTALAGNYIVLAISRMLTAVVSGAIVSLAITFGSFLAPMEKRAGLIAWIFSGFSIAAVFGVPVGTWISSYTSWRNVFWLISLLGVVTLILAMKCLPAGLRQQQTRNFFSQLAIFGDRRIRLGVLLPMFNLAGIYVFYTYLQPLFAQALNFHSNTIAVLLFGYGFMSLLGNLYSGRMADENGLSKLTVVFLLQTILLVTLPVVLGSRWSAVPVIMFLGLTMYLVNSPTQLFFLEVAEKNFPQSMVLASSFNSIFANLGIAIGSAVGSLLYLHTGLVGIGPGGAFFAALALLVNLVLTRLRQSSAGYKKFSSKNKKV
ncbi:MAG: MFS transporter [Liquorilactobacillus nagelii]|uniref:MFS transporter n=1 Tax=Liquorilactobacillus nagelii TaxID=82688 RepID=UPI001CCBDD5B|nr:MFS transporter [Liquorilactobacillus nagelii]MCI1633128.1 MFS transporter [Liquorilactobacillus nagelii]MCI1921011.1 MFS transporter [Liquorilactobacillus nagelii]MCI1975796.1 MFS transporter [Liquorilactobacillus nagelii]ULQ49946.1 MFS transporter [Liquorilactobacillus nagelii]